MQKYLDSIRCSKCRENKSFPRPIHERCEKSICGSFLGSNSSSHIDFARPSCFMKVVANQGFEFLPMGERKLRKTGRSIQVGASFRFQRGRINFERMRKQQSVHMFFVPKFRETQFQVHAIGKRCHCLSYKLLNLKRATPGSPLVF